MGSKNLTTICVGDSILLPFASPVKATKCNFSSDETQYPMRDPMGRVWYIYLRIYQKNQAFMCAIGSINSHEISI